MTTAMQEACPRARRSLAALALAAAALLGAAPDARAVQDHGAGDALPGWYRFYKKSGDQTVLDPEARRDADIADGELTARPLQAPLPDLTLPDGAGGQVGLRDWVGRKNLLIVVNRAWW